MAGKTGIVTDGGWSFHEPPEARYRHYRHNGSTTVDGHDGPLEILSVTQALGIIDKSGPLQHYAAKMTLEGVCATLRGFGCEKDANGDLPTALDVEDICLVAGDPRYLGDTLKRNGRAFYQRTADAASRGTAIHTVLEDWAERGKLPVADSHPMAHRGYVRGLAAFLITERPKFLENEMIVGSVTHGVAGARDTVLVLNDATRGRCLVDLKTSKGVYPSSHFRQLTAYDRLGVESGQQPTDAQGILRVGEDGSYELRWLQDFGFSTDFWWRAFLEALSTQRSERAITKQSPKVGYRR